jgi:apolipoprotein N-acyltransferase
VDDPVFALSLKFAAGLFVLPVWWLILFGVGTIAGGWTAGVAVALLAAATLFLRRLLIRRANPPHVLDEDALPGD